MDLFWKALAGVLLASVLTIQIGRQEPDLALVLEICACVMISIIAITYMKPVLEVLYSIECLGNLKSEFLVILLKAEGIGIVTEIVSNICSDAGRPALGKSVSILGVSSLLYVSIPIYNALIEMIRMIVEET